MQRDFTQNGAISPQERGDDCLVIFSLLYCYLDEKLLLLQYDSQIFHI